MNKITAFFFSILLALSLTGQDPHYFNFNTEHGLPSSETYDIHIDKDNLVWIMTDRGVCTYNGYDFKTYTTQDGLSYNTNFKLFEDQVGNFWFIGFDGQLTVFKNGIFQPFEFNAALKEFHPGLWLDGLIFDGDEIKFSFPRANKNFLNVIHKLDLCSGKMEKVAKPKPFIFNADGNTFQLYNFNNGFFIEQNHNKLIFGKTIIAKDSLLFFFNEKTLYKINLIDSQRETYKFEQIINNISLQEEKKLFACAGGGLFYFEDLDFANSPAHYFKGITPTDIDMDSEGNYWVSTLERGVFKVPSFAIGNIQNNGKNSINEKVLSLGALDEHIVYGTSYNNLFAIDKKFKTNLVLNNNFNRFISSIYVKENTATFPLYNQIKEKGKKIEMSVCIKDRSLGCNLLAELKNNDLICGLNTGFAILDEGRRIDSIYQPSFFPERILCIKEDQNNITWIGTTNGLYYFFNNEYSSYVNASNESSLLKVRINDIKTDAQNNLWLATIGNGIIYKTKDTVFQVSTSDGLNSHLVNRIYVEGDTSVWAGTNKGLNHFSYTYGSSGLKKGNLESYTIEDGIVSDFINDIAGWNGYIWAATNKGLNYFKRNDLKKQFPSPKVILEEVLVDGKNYSDQEGFEFNHYQNDIIFKYTGIAHRKIKNNAFYRYQLQGRDVDSTWFYTNERSVHFTNTSPAKYIFRVHARNKTGKWGPLTEYTFRIFPHFTNTTWFKTLSAIAGLGLLVLIFVWANRFQRKKEKQQRLLNEAQLKTREAELAMLHNQMNPHFIFNVLNAIQNFIFKKDIPQANFFLSKFSSLIRAGLQYSRLKYIPFDKEIQFLKSYLEIETMRFPDKFCFTVNIDKKLEEANCLLPPLLIQPLLENSIKHGFKNVDYFGELEINFSINIALSLLNVIIIDNGSGIESVVQKEQNNNDRASFGTEIVRERLKLLNDETQSSAASISIADRHQLNPEKTGTIVELVIPIKK